MGCWVLICFLIFWSVCIGLMPFSSVFRGGVVHFSFVLVALVFPTPGLWEVLSFYVVISLVVCVACAQDVG